MGRTFRRLGRRNRFLAQRRERLPSIRAVETTFDEINRQTLSPVRKVTRPSALRNEWLNDTDASSHDIIDDNNNIYVNDESDEIDAHNKNEYEAAVECDSNKHVVSDDVTEHELYSILNDVEESNNNEIFSLERPTSSSWATTLEHQVREAEKEYETTAFVDESVKTLDKSSKSYGRLVSVGEMGKIYYKNHKNSSTIHYKRLHSSIGIIWLLIP